MPGLKTSTSLRGGRKTRLAPRVRRLLTRLLLSLALLSLFLFLAKFSTAFFSLHPLSSSLVTTIPSSCALNPETRFFHASLLRGASRAEIRLRPAARQPRDSDALWIPVSRGVWHDAHLPPRRLRDVDEEDLAFLHSTTRLALTVARGDVAGARNASATRAYTRLSRAGRQAAVVTRVSRAGAPSATRVVTVTHPLTAPCSVGLTRPRPDLRLHVILPYARRPHRLRAALDRLAKAARAEGGNRLLAVIAAREEEDITFAEETVATMDIGNIVDVVHVGGDKFGNFSRAVALRDAVAHIPADEAVFFADVDLITGQSFYDSCRINLVKGSQVWFPVFFSLFPYGRGVGTREGFWRTSSYGMVCMFRGDFDAVHGFGGNEETRYAGWGSEDVDLYNRFREHPGYAVFRSLEPELLHVWHGKHCEHNAHYVNCMRTVFMTMASQERLAQVVAESGVDMSSIKKNALPL